jgi:hypothetical protein
VDKYLFVDLASPVRVDRLEVSINPLIEKIRSLGVDVAQTDSHFIAQETSIYFFPTTPKDILSMLYPLLRNGTSMYPRLKFLIRDIFSIWKLGDSCPVGGVTEPIGSKDKTSNS